MTIYVLERNNPRCIPEPEVFRYGDHAKQTMLSEYNAMKTELEITQEEIDNGTGMYGCYENLDDSYCGSISIQSDYDIDRWDWRITAHEI